jgi:hypothetical protein
MSRDPRGGIVVAIKLLLKVFTIIAIITAVGVFLQSLFCFVWCGTPEKYMGAVFK